MAHRSCAYKLRTPRVTVGIATYNRDTYLEEAITSVLEQEGYSDFEVLVCEDGTSNLRVREVVERFDDPRVRVVRHACNKGISAAYNTLVREAAGELLALVGDDDRCLPDRLARQVALFNRYPQTGVVHGDGLIIDPAGARVGAWPSREFAPAELLQTLVRVHNYILDPSRMVHRRVYESVGLYDTSYRLAGDFHFWLRAARCFRFRHTPGGPVVEVRRHGENFSDEKNQALEREEVERALEELFAQTPLPELVPELDWAVLEEAQAKRRALELLAEALERRVLPLPALAAKLRARAAALPRRRVGRSAASRRLLLTAYGWNDSGGGTLIPRLVAKELARRGHTVTVFYAAAAGPNPNHPPYELYEEEEDGVRLFAVRNRPHALFDMQNPLREVEDPPIVAHFQRVLDLVRPEAVHFHNLHNLSAALIDQALARGVPAFFTTHNYWLICPRAYLLREDLTLCAGPGDGTRCAPCVGGAPPTAFAERFQALRARMERGVVRCLAVSEAVRRTLVACGYPPDLVDVVRQATPQESALWAKLGSRRRRGRVADRLVVGFVGSAYPHKGPQLLVQAAQLVEAPLRVEIHGEVPEPFAKRLEELDRRGVVELCGPFHQSELDKVLAGIDVAALPSLWWDCAPLAVQEVLAGGVPAVVPRLGGLAEAVRDGVNGLHFEPLNVSSLAAALSRLATEKGLLERLQEGIAPPRPFSAYVDLLEAYYRSPPPPQGLAPAAAVSLRVRGDHGRPTSLSLINKALVANHQGPLQRVAADGRALDPPLAHAADVEVRHSWPPALEPAPAGRLAVILPWEYGALPRRWAKEVGRNVDRVIVPSECVRATFIAAGLPPERVTALPNGVDLERFKPEGPRYPLGLPPTTKTTLLFVGGLIYRKGPDLLLDAYRTAFAGRDDVVLVVKGAAALGVYREDGREPFAEHVASGALPRVVLVEEELTEEQLAALYRACDVLVHPYRGEGFALPVLEAMASGLPVVVTAGGPTDEFVPDKACWRLPARRVPLSAARVADLETVGQPWLLEPDREALVAALREAADPHARARRGAQARASAQRLSWERVFARYAALFCELARAPRAHDIPAPPPRQDQRLRVLATPAWRAEDRLGELLAEWAEATTPQTNATLLLLADPVVDPEPAALEARLRESGVDFERCADVSVLVEAPTAVRDRLLHRSVDLFVPLHPASAGHLRLAREAGREVVEVGERRLVARLAELTGEPTASPTGGPRRSRLAERSGAAGGG